MDVSSGDGYTLDDVQCFKAAAGAAGGIGFDLQNGTYPFTVHVGQVVGPVSNPLAAGYSVINMNGSFISCNCDGSGSIAATDGLLVGASCGQINIMNFVCNAATNAVHITSSQDVSILGLWGANGTNAILDAGGGASVAKTIAASFVPFYSRGQSAIMEYAQVYAAMLLQSVNITMNSMVTTGVQTATFTATNKPGSGTTAPTKWLPVVADGTTYYIPMWQ